MLSGFDGISWVIFREICSGLELVLDLAALGWFGLWLGLRFRQLPAAVGLNFLVVLVAPWLVTMVLSGMIMMALVRVNTSGMEPLWAISLGNVAIVLILDLAVLIGSRRATHRNLRELASRRHQPVEPRPGATPPPPLPP
jgi:hypothetical protein